MQLKLPALNLKAKLMALLVVLLAMTLGAEVVVSLGTQEAIVEATQEKVKDLANAIQISVQELTSVRNTDRDRLQNFQRNIQNRSLDEITIASKEKLIINSSNPSLIGTALTTPVRPSVVSARVTGPAGGDGVKIFTLGPPDQETTLYEIPVKVEDHTLGYVTVRANFGDFAKPLRDSRMHLITLGMVIFAIGLVFSYVLAERYVEPIHTVAAAAQNIAARGLEPIAEARRRDEIGLLTRSFNEMVTQLRHAREREIELNRLERFTALGQLAGGLAHEIKNPLNFISLAVDQLRARYAPQLVQDRENFLRQLGMMKEEIHRLSELIQSFLHYGKSIEVFPSTTDVRALVRNVLALSDAKFRSQGIEMVQEGHDVPAVLNVDAEKLRTCFINVVANAVQAMPEGGTLGIAFSQDDGKLTIRFSDSGAGIDPQVAGHAFEPFFTTKREGIGLGLFLSRTIVEGHGGTIAIGPNRPGPGTTVTFTFPVRSGNKQP
ncbi:MAG: HAMP domain-containing sensor histidine kinase [Candidatus Binataceae bacterium]